MASHLFVIKDARIARIPIAAYRVLSYIAEQLFIRLSRRTADAMPSGGILIKTFKALFLTLGFCPQLYGAAASVIVDALHLLSMYICL